MIKARSLVGGAIAGALLIVACLATVAQVNAAATPQLCTLEIDSVILRDVPQVTTYKEMAKGLSLVHDVGPGMLFTWEHDEVRAFWMKDTYVPLSIGFIDANGVIVQIEDMEPETETYHWSTVPVREALELKQGEFDRLGLGVGSRVIARNCKKG